MIYTIFFTIIALFIFTKCVNYINLKEENIINIGRRDKIFVFISFFLIFNLLSVDNKGLTLFLYNVFGFYLITTAYIDFKVKSIYGFINGISLMVMIILIIPKYKYLNYKAIILSLIIVSVFAILNKFIEYVLGNKPVGEGDIDLYFISSLILSTKGYFSYSMYDSLLTKVLLNRAFLLINLSIVIGGIAALFFLIFKKGKGIKSIAFAPAITIASLFILLFI